MSYYNDYLNDVRKHWCDFVDKSEKDGKTEFYQITSDIPNKFVLANFIEKNLNGGFLSGNPFKSGVQMGIFFTRKHRTLQGMMINWCLGILYGISFGKDETDERNEVGVQECAKIADAIDNGGIHLNPYI